MSGSNPAWTRRPLIVLALLVAVLLGLGIDATRRFHVDTSMEHFLPGNNERKLYRVSRQVIDSTLTGRMIVTVGLQDPDISRDERRLILHRASEQLRTELAQIKGITKITHGPPDGLEESFFELYFPRRFAFFSLNPEEDARDLLSEEGLARQANQLKRKLAGAESVFVRQLAPKDPWLLFLDFLSEAEQSAVRLDVVEGQFFARPQGDSKTGVKASEDYAILFAELRDSALDSAAQRPVLQGIRASIARVQEANEASLTIETSGANRFAVATEASMKADIERVFSLSTAGLLVLFLIFFRSLRRVLFLLLPIVAGLVVALWVSLLVLGDIHALTLAFGGALIGIAIDYPVHVLSHHDLGPKNRSGQASAIAILPTLSLAAGTTIVGLLGLAWASFPGIREIALFSCVGVAAALVTTLFIADILPQSGQAPRLSQAVSRKLESLLEVLQRRPGASWALLGGAFTLAISSLSTVRFAPGLDSLAPLDSALLAEDARVQERVGDVDGGKLAIALAPNLEQALQINESIARTLTLAQEDKLVREFTNASTLLRSTALQTRSEKVFSNAKRISQSTKKALETAGFVASAFPSLEKELASTPQALTRDELLQSPLAPLIETLIFSTDREAAVITPLAGVTQEEALEKRLAKIPGAHYFSQRALLNQAYSDLRTRTAQLLFIGLLFVFLAAVLRYRNLRRAIAAVLPSVLACGATIGLLAILNVEINLLHLLGLLLVCSMGVDYGVFLVDADETPMSPALLSITVGCLSTMMSFGALSLSAAPALAALGSSIGIGILLSLLIAPVAFLLLRGKPSSPSS